MNMSNIARNSVDVINTMKKIIELYILVLFIKVVASNPLNVDIAAPSTQTNIAHSQQLWQQQQTGKVGPNFNTNHKQWFQPQTSEQIRWNENISQNLPVPIQSTTSIPNTQSVDFNKWQSYSTSKPFQHSNRNYERPVETKQIPGNPYYYQWPYGSLEIQSQVLPRKDFDVHRYISQNPLVKSALETTNHQTRFTVIHPDGRMEKIDDIKSLVEKNPNYILINKKNVQSKPYTTASATSETTLDSLDSDLTSSSAISKSDASSASILTSASAISETVPSLTPILKPVSAFAEATVTIPSVVTSTSAEPESLLSLSPSLKPESTISEAAVSLTPVLTSANVAPESDSSLASILTSLSAISENSPSLIPSVTSSSAKAESDSLLESHLIPASAISGSSPIAIAPVSLTSKNDPIAIPPVVTSATAISESTPSLTTVLSSQNIITGEHLPQEQLSPVTPDNYEIAAELDSDICVTKFVDETEKNKRNEFLESSETSDEVQNEDVYRYEMAGTPDVDAIVDSILESESKVDSTYISDKKTSSAYTEYPSTVDAFEVISPPSTAKIFEELDSEDESEDFEENSTDDYESISETVSQDETIESDKEVYQPSVEEQSDSEDEDDTETITVNISDENHEDHCEKCDKASKKSKKNSEAYKKINRLFEILDGKYWKQIFETYPISSVNLLFSSKTLDDAEDPEE